MRRKVVLLILVFLLSILLVIFWNYYSYSRKYLKKVEIIVKPLNEECDNYQNIWEVINVSDNEFNFLKGEGIYFTNSKRNYRESKYNFSVNGYLFKRKRIADYIGCQNIWFFEDQSHP